MSDDHQFNEPQRSTENKPYLAQKDAANVARLRESHAGSRGRLGRFSDMIGDTINRNNGRAVHPDERARKVGLVVRACAF
jgi:hypothetical protein